MVMVVPEADTLPSTACVVASLLVNVSVAKLLSERPPFKLPVMPAATSSLIEIRKALEPEDGVLGAIDKSLG
jgi:hypothetical protein